MTMIKNIRSLIEDYSVELPAFLGSTPLDPPIARWIDHTLLKPEATPAQIDQLCEEAIANQFAAVCVNPIFVTRVANALRGSGVKTCTVVGFPLGAVPTATKVFETREAITQGAEEIDMVIPIGLLKAGEFEQVYEDIRQVAEACHAQGAILKVIIETILLDRKEKIAASLLTREAGADFVKTSTGFAGGGATPEDVELLRRVVGPDLGVKAAGGVRSLADAYGMLRSGATRLGTSAGTKIAVEERELKQ